MQTKKRLPSKKEITKHPYPKEHAVGHGKHESNK